MNRQSQDGMDNSFISNLEINMELIINTLGPYSQNM